MSEFRRDGEDVAEWPYVAAIQTVSGPDVQANLGAAADLIAQAAVRGARLVALPEHFALMGLAETDKVRAAETPGDGPIQSFLAETARRQGVWIIGGSIPLRCADPKRVRNSSLVFDATGALAARYDKIHLFGLDMGEERYTEANTIEPGDRVVALDTPFGRLGLSVCYDVRFPELYRAMGEVDIISIPAAFTQTTGRAHWETLMRARAIENLAYVMAPAQGGRHPSGRETHGDTMIVDPWGTVVERLPRGPGIALARIDLSHLRGLRRSLPALRHRRNDIRN